MSSPPHEGYNESLSLSSIRIVVLLCAPLAVSLIFVPWVFFRGKKEHEKSLPGCRKLGLRGRSNLSDQYDSSYSRAATTGNNTDGSPLWRVKALFIYPVKSCGPVELDQSEVERTGLAYDRQFAFAQLVSPLPRKQEDGSHTVDHHWEVITLRQFPLLSKIKTEVWVPDKSSPNYSSSGDLTQTGGWLVMAFPFTPVISFGFQGLGNLWSIITAKVTAFSFHAEPEVSFRIPLNPSAELTKQRAYDTEKLVIFKDTPDALNVTPAIPAPALAQLKYFLHARNPLALFRVAPSKQREVHRCAPRAAEVGYQPIVGFADGYPLHMLNLASVHDVASRLPPDHGKLSALRFRANIYITGPDAFAEDGWKSVRVDAGTYHVSCRTARCMLPNVDPETGVKDRNQPLATLRSYRLIDGGAGMNPCLGMQMVPASGGGGEVKVGDEVDVLETGEHWYIMPGQSTD